MQPDFVGTNQTKEVCSHVFGKVLKFRSRHLFARVTTMKTAGSSLQSKPIR